MSRTYVVVAESSRAKLYQVDGIDAPFVELEDLAHPASREHEDDLVTSPPGSVSDSRGQHGLPERDSAKHHESVVFAKQLAERVEAARIANRFDHLMLVAPPEFLGLLRDGLSTTTRALVEREVHKNLVRQGPEEIRSQIF